MHRNICIHILLSGSKEWPEPQVEAVPGESTEALCGGLWEDYQGVCRFMHGLIWWLTWKMHGTLYWNLIGCLYLVRVLCIYELYIISVIKLESLESFDGEISLLYVFSMVLS